MADEQYKWLTGETAERLLRGESLEAVDAPAPDQAERLAKALGALSAEAAPATGELPGEQAALAAFRKVREAAEAERTAAALAQGTPARRSGSPTRDADAGLVRIGAPTRTGTRSRRPRWARPVRFALAAAVAAGTLGGVAMATGGVLPLPFHDERPGPTASVSAAQSPEQPLASPSAQSTQGLAPGTIAPDGGTGGSLGAPSGGATAPDPGTDQGATPGSRAPSRSPGTWWRVAARACRDLRDGKELGAERRRALEGLAGGSVRVTTYCKYVLAGHYAYTGEGRGTGDDGGGKGTGDGRGKDQGKDKGEGDGNGQGGDDEGHPGRGHHHGRGHGGDRRGHDAVRRDDDRRDRAVSPARSALAPVAPGRRTTAPVPSPSPSYTAL
ncbi:hypothetical protein ACIRU3_00935 [Streptomyces sp. NPDC101151]|uniref:hypothetical protein n=1 Tax=Streptomyces sp. NPDC101151 TaxID=3366115 RepID=UPI0037FB26CC